MSHIKLSQVQVDHIALLSRLDIDPDDKNFGQELSEAADYIQVLDELDITGVHQTSQVNHKHSIFRSDKITPSFSQSVALSQAPRSFQGFFVTKATIKK